MFVETHPASCRPHCAHHGGRGGSQKDSCQCYSNNPAKADESPALTTPLTYTGPPEELGAELGKHLAGHAQTDTQTASTLAEAKATMDAAAKVPQEEAKHGNPNETHQNAAATRVFNFVQTGQFMNWYLT